MYEIHVTDSHRDHYIIDRDGGARRPGVGNPLQFKDLEDAERRADVIRTGAWITVEVRSASDESFWPIDEIAAERLLADLGKFELLPVRESAAERRAKAEAAELTPEALTALGQFDVPRLPGAPAVVKELFIDGKRMALGERQVVEPEIGAGFTVIVRAEDVRWTIGGREVRQPDHRSDRENRTDSALAEFNRHLDPRVLLVDDLGLWAKAVEWYENRPIGGDTDGEALYGCAAMFLPGAKACRWANVLDHERLAFERAAKRLIRHRL